MAQVPDNNSSLAVLIDADNASATIIEELLAEVAKLGVASVKRIYGDWTKPHISGWKDAVLKHALQPVQQFAYTNGKNATDIAMVIDAMDLLHSGRLSGFCIVSSDSDFTRLAARIRESGLKVYGFGELKTPEPLRNACDKFLCIEMLKNAGAESDKATPASSRKENLGSGQPLKLSVDYSKHPLPELVRQAKEYLVQSTQNRPSKLKALESALASRFSKQLTEARVNQVINAMKKTGIISVGPKNELTYVFA